MIGRRGAIATLTATFAGFGGCARAQDASATVPVSVRDPRFAGGARGDGHTDDSGAIQAAIDTAPAVFLPAGIYLVARSLRIPSDRRLFGEGAATVLRKADEAGDRLIVNADPGGNARITIERLTLDGRRGSSAFVMFRDGLYLRECSECVVRDLVVRDCLNDGIIVEGGADNRVTGCAVTGNAKDGIYVSGSRAATVDGNRAIGNLLGGIAVAATREAAVNDNVCSGNRVDILLGRDASHVAVLKNQCRSATAFAVSPETIVGQVLHGKRYPARPGPGWDSVYGASYCRIQDNLLAGQVRLIMLDDSEVSSNQCTGSAAQGIVLQGASRNRIVGNVVRGWGRGFGGIQLAALTAGDGIPASQHPPIASADNVLDGNLLRDANGRAGIIDAGLRTIIRGHGSVTR